MKSASIAAGLIFSAAAWSQNEWREDQPRRSPEARGAGRRKRKQEAEAGKARASALSRFEFLLDWLARVRVLAVELDVIDLGKHESLLRLDIQLMEDRVAALERSRYDRAALEHAHGELSFLLGLEDHRIGPRSIARGDLDAVGAIPLD